MLTVPARLLGDAERAAVERILDADPIAAAQVAERVGSAGLSWRVDARVFGYGSRRRLESICWLGANLIPVHADHPAGGRGVRRSAPAASAAVLVAGRRLRGGARPVEPLAQAWGPARDVRPASRCWPPGRRRRCRPIRPSGWSARTRSTRSSRPRWPCTPRRSAFRRWPATAAATTGTGSATWSGPGGRTPSSSVAGSCSRRNWPSSPGTRPRCKGSGWRPEWRGRGLGTAAMAAVVRDALRRVAPSVSLYVNDYNAPARRSTSGAGSAGRHVRHRPALTAAPGVLVHRDRSRRTVPPVVDRRTAEQSLRLASCRARGG